jgi:hypothetical protein
VTIQIRIRGRSAGTCTATTEASGPVSDANNANNRASVTITFRGAAGQLTDGGSDCFLCCFIATAAYGSPLENQVNHLRHFRDEALQPSETGRDFVRTYYATSPVMANFIRDKAAARLITRRLLEPLADLTKPNTP